MKTVSRVVAASCFAALMVLSLCVAPVQSYAEPVSEEAVMSDGWHSDDSGKYYVKSGSKVTGIKFIEKGHYAFDAEGMLITGTKVVNGVTYYASEDGLLEMYKKSGTYIKPNGVSLLEFEVKEYEALLHARSWLAKIVSPEDSKEEQMRKALAWVNDGTYYMYRYFNNRAGWSAEFADDHFVRVTNGKRMGDCNSDACAYAYLCVAIGCEDVVIGIEKVTNNVHCNLRIEGKHYDPFRVKNKGDQHAAYDEESWEATVQLTAPSYKNDYTISAYSGKMPSYSVTITNVNSKTVFLKEGINKIDGSYYFLRKGKLVKGKWVTYKGATYHFGKDGKAAVGTVKLKKNGKKGYYVFSLSGKLFEDKSVKTKKGKKKTRVVRVKTTRYCVNYAGKAVSGWNKLKSGKKCYSFKNGVLATGPALINGKLYVFSKKGIYSAKKTSSARKLAVVDEPIGNLASYFGATKKLRKWNSCNVLYKPGGDGEMVAMEGSDKIYTYKHMTLITFVADGDGGDGREYFVMFVAK